MGKGPPPRETPARSLSCETRARSLSCETRDLDPFETSLWQPRRQAWWWWWPTPRGVRACAWHLNADMMKLAAALTSA